MASEMDRRTFVKGSLAAGLSLAASSIPAADATNPATTPAPAPPAAAPNPLPQGSIGKLKISRLLLGGNLLSRYNHARDLRYVQRLCASYLTDEKILETLAKAEEHGVNTLSVHFDPNVMRLIKQHRQRGGKMQWILHTKVPLAPGLSDFTEAIRKLVDDGADALYIWGVHCDPLVASGQVDQIARAVEVIKLSGLPAGVAGHDLKVVEECERIGVANDFYVKTFHHHKYPSAPRPDELKGPVAEVPGYWCRDPQRTIEVMQNVKKSWIAYKVMAAGAIPPEDAFNYAFKNGADFVLAGMFDFEIAEDAQLVRKILAGELPRRPRPWVA
jgi:hypothetical protein